jgi:hypothetical protein
VFILLIFEFIVWILVYIIYEKLRLEARQKQLEKQHRRKLNTVAEQLTILKPAFGDVPNEKKKEDIELKENRIIIVDENLAVEVPFEKVDKKIKTPEQLRSLKKFIENEKSVSEKAFKKDLDVEEAKKEDLPLPPDGF